MSLFNKNTIIYSLFATLCFGLEVEWSDINPRLPIPLFFACISRTVDNVAYIMGGYDSNNNASQKIFTFNMSSYNINELQIQTPTNEFVCVQSTVYSKITKKIYIMGIYTDDWTSTMNYEFDTVKMTFSAIPQVNHSYFVIRESCVSIYNTSIYIYGGWEYYWSNHYQYTNTLYKYDILTKQWTKKQSNTMIASVINGGCLAIDNSIYTFGGWDGNSNNILRLIYKYDIKNDNWSNVASLKYATWYRKAVLFKSLPNTIAIIGGQGNKPNSYRRVELFNYSSYNVLSTIGDFQLHQGGINMATEHVDGGIIAFGGTDNQCSVGFSKTTCPIVFQNIYVCNIVTSTTQFITTHTTNAQAFTTSNTDSYIQIFTTSELYMQSTTTYASSDLYATDVSMTSSTDINKLIFLVTIICSLVFVCLAVISCIHTEYSYRNDCRILTKNGCYKSDVPSVRVVIKVFLRICDLITDVALVYTITGTYIMYQTELLLILSVCSFTFLIIPYIINLISIVHISKLDNIVIERPTIWFSKYMFVFVSLTLITGDCFVSAQVISSNLFGLNVFNSGLNIVQLNSIKHIQIINIVTESIPQSVIQGIYGYYNGITPLLLLSVFLSLLSSISNSLSWCITGHIHHKCKLVQYVLKVTLIDNGTDQTNKKKELLQIIKYRGCTRILRNKICLILGIETSKLQIGCVDMNDNGCNINIIQTVMTQTDFCIQKFYQNKYNEISDEIKKVYYLQWDIRTLLEGININTCTIDGMEDTNNLKKGGGMSTSNQYEIINTQNEHNVNEDNDIYDLTELGRYKSTAL
eukprot:207647_1